MFCHPQVITVLKNPFCVYFRFYVPKMFSSSGIELAWGLPDVKGCTLSAGYAIYQAGWCTREFLFDLKTHRYVRWSLNVPTRPALRITTWFCARPVGTGLAACPNQIVPNIFTAAICHKGWSVEDVLCLLIFAKNFKIASDDVCNLMYLWVVSYHKRNFIFVFTFSLVKGCSSVRLNLRSCFVNNVFWVTWSYEVCRHLISTGLKVVVSRANSAKPQELWEWNRI